MTRLIDADDLMRAVMAQDVVDKSVVKRLIIQAPIVDAIRVVRCKNCRWYDKVDWCNKLRISGVKAVEDTWFCADGERKDDDNA